MAVTLHVHAQPSERIFLLDTQPPLFPGESTVRRYMTRRGVVFQQHITHDGKVTWFKEVQKPDAQTP